MNTKSIISSILTLVLILGFSLSGCERVKQITTPDTIATVKIGIIQPSGLAPSFTKGAELIKYQINSSGGYSE